MLRLINSVNDYEDTFEHSVVELSLVEQSVVCFCRAR